MIGHRRQLGGGGNERRRGGRGARHQAIGGGRLGAHGVLRVMGIVEGGNGVGEGRLFGRRIKVGQIERGMVQRAAGAVAAAAAAAAERPAVMRLMCRMVTRSCKILAGQRTCLWAAERTIWVAVRQVRGGTMKRGRGRNVVSVVTHLRLSGKLFVFWEGTFTPERHFYLCRVGCHSSNVMWLIVNDTHKNNCYIEMD